MQTYQTINKTVLVIGSGGAGTTVANHLASNNVDVACISKTKISENHTALAQGGINACLGNVKPDDYKWFIYDTLKGGNFLSDHDSVEILCRDSKDAIEFLQDKGVPFTLDDEGRIYQRPYGGQTLNFGKELAYRACCIADKTGQGIMDVLHKEASKQQVDFYEDFFALNLIIDNNQIEGLLCLNLTNLELVFFKSQFIVIAAGGVSQIYHTNTSLDICTGDGNSLALKAGIMLQDMEFIQFHPTGIKGSGKLISEAARAEGGYLTNSLNQKFMAHYSPKLKDLSSRDLITRAIFSEILAGRGVTDDKDSIYLNVQNLPKETILNLLPNVYETAKENGIDATKEPIAIKPTAHYVMGGIPTNKDAEVTYNHNNTAFKISGLYAIGETASSGVHGANRLGCNSLLETIIFGKVASRNILKKLSDHNKTSNKNTEELVKSAIKNFQNIYNDNPTQNYNIATVKLNLQKIMEHYVGVIRTEESLTTAYNLIEEIYTQNKHITLAKNTKASDLQKFLELQNLILQSRIVIKSALERTESRGAHFRADYPDTDNQNFLKHSLCGMDKNGELIYGNTKVRMLDEYKEFINLA